MSIEVWQFPQSGTKDQLIETLVELGFERGENLFWRGPQGTVSLFWSEPDEFISTSGVDASVFPLDDQGRQVWATDTDWALRTRTSIWASSFDKEFQNHAVRTVRKNFGGHFHNDRQGKNRYTVIERVPSTPASRGVFSIVSRVSEELNALEAALPEELFRELGTPRGVVADDVATSRVLHVVKRLDPARVVYNALVPFLVAAMEHFFRATFEVLLKYDPHAREALQRTNRKVLFAEAVAIEEGELSTEQIASGWYSFQNLDSIQRAYEEVLGIDVWKVIRRRKKMRDKLPILSEALQNLIGARHGVVHHFSLDRDLDHDGFTDLLHLVRALIDVIVDEIERKLGVAIGPA